MRFETLDASDIARIYPIHMARDFPPDELKPLSAILACLRAGSCRCYGLYDGAELVAYASVLLGEPGDAGILDYLATVPERRGRGVGGEMLRRLREACGDCAALLIEYEAPEDAGDGEDQSERRRREAFYLRNGVRRTGIHLILFGVHYRVGCLPCAREVPEAALKAMQKAVYDRVGSWDYHFLDDL